MGKSRGKAGKIKRHDPLAVPLERQIVGNIDADGDRVNKRGHGGKKAKKREARRRPSQEEDMEGDTALVRMAAAQRADVEGVSGDKEDQRVRFAKSAGGGMDFSDDDSDIMGEDGGDYDGQEYYEELELTEADEADLARFMNPNPAAAGPRTIADLIMEKLEEKQNQGAFASSELERSLNPKVVQVYKGVGQILTSYRSGKLPRAFKAIPNLKNWEEILYLTRPDKYSPAAMYAATRVFASNLRPHAAQRFYGLVLLPRIRDDIQEYGKLNFHLYQCLKKALYKPGAFYKGILLPLCEERSCTLREATIIGSVLQKVSIPVLHSAAALLKISEMEYSGPVSLFMRILLNKKYALPYRVLDAIVNHFIEFIGDSREMPVLWHQCLLTFVQRYKAEITVEEKDMLKKLLRVKIHPKITPEIRRELFNAPSRGETDGPVDPMQA